MPHPRSRRILSCLAVLALAISGCNTSNPAPPGGPPPPVPPNPPAGTTTSPGYTYEILPFKSEGERTQHEKEQYEKEVRCLGGNGSKGSPFLCIDNATIRPDPYYARVWDFEGQNGQPTNRPVVVHWLTKRSATVRIEFQTAANGEACVVNQPVCGAGGHCSAVVRPLGNEPSRTCKYNIWIDGQILDQRTPEFAVNPCCW